MRPLGCGRRFRPARRASFSARQFDLLAAEMNENADARGRNVVTAVRSAWLDLYYWEQAHQLVVRVATLL